MKTSIRIAIRTLGCKLNQNESVGIQEALEQEDFVIVNPDEKADIYIINTCTVTGKTDRRSRQYARQAMTLNPAAKVIIAGCGAQRDINDFINIPGVCAIIGNREKNRITDFVHQVATEDSKIVEVSDLKNAPFERLKITRFRHYTRAFVKIQDGCNGFCSYCIIPTVRGPARSQIPNIVLDDITQLVHANYREIVLTGIDLGTYGFDLQPKTDLFTLVNQIKQIPGLGRIRLSSLEPMELTQELLGNLLDSDKVSRHFHIPLQSGHNATLRRMNRSYSREEFSELVHFIKSVSPDTCIGADVIVGFPGETDNEFISTYHFIESLPVDYLHVFSFSAREGTAAASFPNKVPAHSIKERSNHLRSLSLRKATSFRKQLIGKVVSAIILGVEDGKSGLSQALSDNYVRVLLTGQIPPKGNIVPIHIDSSVGLESFGHCCDQ